jgi:hypothetical protein
MVKDDKTPKSGAGGNVRTEKIMTLPLPQILDGIEDSIKLADEAAKDARNAAEEARLAGKKAASEAAEAAALMVARVEKIAKEALELARLLNSTMTAAADIVEKKLNKNV